MVTEISDEQTHIECERCRASMTLVRKYPKNGPYPEHNVFGCRRCGHRQFESMGEPAMEFFCGMSFEEQVAFCEIQKAQAAAIVESMVDGVSTLHEMTHAGLVMIIAGRLESALDELLLANMRP